MTDVSTGGEDDRIALFFLLVLFEELCQVKHLVEKGDPTVVGGRVGCDLLRGVEVADLVGARDVFGIFDGGGPRFFGRRDTSQCS